MTDVQEAADPASEITTVPDVQAAETTAAEQPPAAAAGNVVVEMQVFGRSVRVEAPTDLGQVSTTALELWRELDGPDGQGPFGTSGFMASEPMGPPPPDMDARGMQPLYEGRRGRAPRR